MKIIIICGTLFLLIWANKIRIYLKREKKAKRNVAPFYRWPESIHRMPEQKEQLRQAKQEKFLIQYQNKEKGIAQIKGDTDSAVFWCNLGMCQCEQFKKTHRPCKHIYKMAIEKGLI
jgi:hypothetical protein